MIEMKRIVELITIKDIKDFKGFLGNRFPSLTAIRKRNIGTEYKGILNEEGNKPTTVNKKQEKEYIGGTKTSSNPTTGLILFFIHSL